MKTSDYYYYYYYYQDWDAFGRIMKFNFIIPKFAKEQLGDGTLDAVTLVIMISSFQCFNLNRIHINGSCEEKHNWWSCREKRHPSNSRQRKSNFTVLKESLALGKILRNNKRVYKRIILMLFQTFFLRIKPWNVFPYVGIFWNVFFRGKICMCFSL